MAEDTNEHLGSSNCSSSSFIYRGIKFKRTSKGYWFFDNPPSCGNAWERYGTDGEMKAIGDTAISVDAALPIMHKMIDRMLENRIVYAGDLRYR